MGQAVDLTAIAVLKVSDSGQTDLGGNPLPLFDCVHLDRWPLGVAYPTVVKDVAKLFDGPELHYAMDHKALTRVDYERPRLVIDGTGVGRAVVDLFFNTAIDAEVLPMTIVSGDVEKETRWFGSSAKSLTVSKKHLVSSVQAGLQSGRLRIVPSLPLASVLKGELQDFKVRVTDAGHEVFNAREGKHDDILLAVAMSVWLGSRPVHYGSWGPNPLG